ncbi:MAG: LPXTG cell wall anchor domain-containing protein [Oscillospiraceae bacterium]|nr:LPXTG cell wall anchor domain-containing protein [Oscillospiraceae bacterium]
MTLPQTGQLRWPVPVMAGAGMLLFASGLAVKRERNGSAARRR